MTSPRKSASLCSAAGGFRRPGRTHLLVYETSSSTPAEWVPTHESWARSRSFSPSSTRKTGHALYLLTRGTAYLGPYESAERTGRKRVTTPKPAHLGQSPPQSLLDDLRAGL